MNEKKIKNILKVEGVKAKGFGIIPKLAMQDDRLSIEAKAIYSYFCSFAGAGTTAFPSIEKIVKDLGISVKRYYRHFELLKRYGYIKTTQIKNENSGKFDRNIYTLVENPEEIPEEQEKEVINRDEQIDDLPISQNDQSGTLSIPFGRFAYTQNDQSNNNKNKNNNNIYNIPSVNHNSINNNTSNSTYNRTSNINNNIYNNIHNKATKKEKKENEGMEGMKDGKKDNELEIIYEKSQVEFFNEDIREFIKKTILDLWYSKHQRVKQQVLTEQEIRKKLRKLTLDTLDYAIRKFKESKNFTKVNNPEKYFRVILLDSIDEALAERIRTG